MPELPPPPRVQKERCVINKPSLTHQSSISKKNKKKLTMFHRNPRKRLPILIRPIQLAKAPERPLDLPPHGIRDSRIEIQLERRFVGGRGERLGLVPK